MIIQTIRKKGNFLLSGILRLGKADTHAFWFG
jgi:hypothetical protein